MGFGQKQSGFMNSNQTNWNQNNFIGMSVPQVPPQTSNFGMSGQNSGFGFGQQNQMGLNPQGFNPNQGLNSNLGFNNQGFNPNTGFNNNQQRPGTGRQVI